MTKKTYTKKELLAFYTMMKRIREFESKAFDCFSKGMLAGNIHVCLGQEAVAAGAFAALEEGDYMTSTHRGHGHCIAKGATTDRMMAELFGKETGYCKGKGGSMHIADAKLRSLGANGIVGAGIGIATGSALASHLQGDQDVTLCIFGDSASNQGLFHEAVNMAATWKLPVVYLCENNGYGVSAEIQRMIHTKTISERAKAYDIPGKTIDGNNVLAVYEAVKDAVEYAREGNGPSVVECLTYRHTGHFCGDPAGYRPASYLEEAQKKDALARMVALLLKNGVSKAEIEKIDEEMKEELEQAVAFAVNSPFPNPSEVLTDVYTIGNERSVAR